jgi:large subunit ribosomal protein L29
MAVIRVSEIRKLKPDERAKKLHELELQLIKYRSKVLAGGELVNPGIIKEIKRAIARIKTINHEDYLNSLKSSDE